VCTSDKQQMQNWALMCPSGMNCRCSNCQVFSYCVVVWARAVEWVWNTGSLSLPCFCWFVFAASIWISCFAKIHISAKTITASKSSFMQSTIVHIFSLSCDRAATFVCRKHLKNVRVARCTQRWCSYSVISGGSSFVVCEYLNMRNSPIC